MKVTFLHTESQVVKWCF